MRLGRVLALALVLPLSAHARSLETVIVTPVAANLTFSNPNLARADRVANLMAEARASQAKLLADLQPMTLGADAAVTEVHPLWLVNRVVVTATPEVIKNLSKRADVQAVRVPKKIELIAAVGSSVEAPKGDKFTYGLKKLRVPETWEKFNVDGSGIVVGHIDTGVYSIHPDLAGKILKFKDFHGHDHPTGFDGQGHGTHTAGTIVGGSASNAKKVGVAPGAKLIVGRIFDNGGGTTDAIVLRCMNWIADPDGDANTNDAPRLVSNSWGGPQTSEVSGDDLWDAVQHWLDLGILPVFAGGNSGPKGKVGTPGGYPMSFCVGSTNWMNWTSYFSSRGPVKWDGQEYIKPDVAAPGSGIESCKDKGGYTTLDGTSMACPHVAGVAALVLQANPGLTPTQVVDIIRSTATDLSSAGNDNNTGHGLVDAYKAVEKAKALKDSGFTAAHE